MKLPPFVEKHPWEVGAAVFVVGIILVYMLFGRSSSSASQTATSDPLTAYYNAQAANSVSSNQLTAALAGDQAGTTQALYGDQAMTAMTALQGTEAQNIAAIYGNTANYEAGIAGQTATNIASINTLGQYWSPFLLAPGSYGGAAGGGTNSNLPPALTVPAGLFSSWFGGNNTAYPNGAPTALPDQAIPLFGGNQSPTALPDQAIPLFGSGGMPVISPFGQPIYNA